MFDPRLNFVLLAERERYRQNEIWGRNFLASLAVAVGTLHITVWNPTAKVPGRSLGEIYAEIAARGEGVGMPFIVAWAGFWSIAAIAFPVLCHSARLTPRMTAFLGLLMLGGTIATQWFAGTPMAMSLADTFGTTGDDAAISGTALSVAGQIAIVAALLIGLAPAATAQLRRFATRDTGAS